MVLGQVLEADFQGNLMAAVADHPDMLAAVARMPKRLIAVALEEVKLFTNFKLLPNDLNELDLAGQRKTKSSTRSSISTSTSFAHS